MASGTLKVRRRYSTSFLLTENPMREGGGRWIHGGETGLDWQNFRTSPGFARGAGSSPSTPPYNDPTVVLAGSWARAQAAEATIIVPATPNGFQELELRLLTSITAHSITGYEVLFSVTDDPYVEIVRWAGPIGTSFADFFFVDHQVGPRLQTGYRVKATVTAAGLITAYVDSGSGYVQIAQGTDTTWTSGAPGMGHWNHGSGPLDFGFSSYAAWEL